MEKEIHNLGYKYRILAVLKRHTDSPSYEEMQYVEEMLRKIADKTIPGSYFVDKENRTIPDHWHLQAQGPAKVRK